MGNEISLQSPNNDDQKDKQKPAYAEFLSSAGKTIGQASGVVCGSLSDTFEEDDKNNISASYKRSSNNGFMSPDDDASLQPNPMSQLFARALLNEVTDNPSTMTPAKMAEREKRLLRAQQRANSATKDGMRAIAGQGTMKSQLQGSASRIIPPNLLSEHRAQVRGNYDASVAPKGKHSVTIGLLLSRRDANAGHPGTITRQSAFDFNELQDRDYKYVSSTDPSGWRAGGGEKGGPPTVNDSISNSMSDDNDFDNHNNTKASQAQKIPAPDMVHVPIIHIDCESESSVNAVIAALARGEVFIPHMSVMPEALGVNGISPPDLVVRFGCERNDDFPPEEWPNWCLEFMHNQLYEYFSDMGARWMKRPFQITLAKKVRWKTVKHMNKFFAQSETVVNSWREKGPQYLDPQLAHIEGGATPEEVARPHGIYLLRNGKPTNYFAPNFEPPYTTKMTRSLVQNVIAKSWDKRKRDWSTEPIPIVTPSLLFSTMCGCAEPNQGGFVAREATNHFSPIGGGGTYFGDMKYDYDLTMNENLQHDRQLMQGTNKIVRKDSGITRSQIGDNYGKAPTMAAPSPKRDNASVVSGRSGTMSQRTESSAGQSSDNYGFGQQRNDRDFPHSPATASEDSGELFDLGHSNEDEENDQKPSKPNEFQKANLDFASPPMTNFDKSPANFQTPLINNRNTFTHTQDQTFGESPQAADQNSNNLPRRTKEKEQPINDEFTANSFSPPEGNGRNSTSVSVGESQTTVPTMNHSSAKFIEQERERRKQREIEREKERRKIDELEMAIQEKLRLHEEKKSKKLSMGGKRSGQVPSKSLLESPSQTPQQLPEQLPEKDHEQFPEEPPTMFASEDESETKKKEKKAEKKAKKDKKKREKKERKERERSKSAQRNRIDAPKEEKASSPSTKENHVNRQFDSDRVNVKSRQNPLSKTQRGSLGMLSEPVQANSYLPGNLTVAASPKKKIQHIFPPGSPASGNMEIHSAPSMDYSMDTASLLGDGSLIGGQFAGDGSVLTMGTNASDNKSLLSYVTRSTVHDIGGSGNHNIKKDLLASPQEDDDLSLTLMASSSTGGGNENVPSDDELFSIGWAKALDPTSGYYYYFTLDRSKTVWENPLTKHLI